MESDHSLELNTIFGNDNNQQDSEICSEKEKNGDDYRLRRYKYNKQLRSKVISANESDEQTVEEDMHGLHLHKNCNNENDKRDKENQLLNRHELLLGKTFWN